MKDMNPKNSNLIWIDLEMTGLDPEIDRIIEIATIVTDSNLNVISEGPNIAVYQPDDLLDQMDEWNTKHHNQSGLVGRVRSSQMTEEKAQELGMTPKAEIVDYIFTGQDLMDELLLGPAYAISELLKRNNLELDEVVVGHFIANKQSQRVIEKCGFIYTHQEKRDDFKQNKMDTKMYHMTKQMYKEMFKDDNTKT